VEDPAFIYQAGVPITWLWKMSSVVRFARKNVREAWGSNIASFSLGDIFLIKGWSRLKVALTSLLFFQT